MDQDDALLPHRGPDLSGGSLVNLVAELERRLSGGSVEATLHTPLAALIPEAATYVVVLFDGLGADMVGGPGTRSMAGDLRATIDAPFPTTTTVTLATLATATSPIRHGLLGYQLRLPDLDVVANTIKWTTLWGDPIGTDTESFLPAPNLWERLGSAGVEAVVVQPANFAGSPLSRLLYRGARFEPVYDVDELILVTRQMASTPGRLVLAYLPHVDYAAHVYGPSSPQHVEALMVADHVWSSLSGRMPGVTLIGTADHGVIEVPAERQVRIARPAEEGLTLYGDSRVMFVSGDGERLAADLPAAWVPLDAMRQWWGVGEPSQAVAARLPDGVLVVDDGYVVLHRHSDERLVGHHGGLSLAEREIPLLVGRG